MNKYVVRTSCVWLAAFAVVAGLSWFHSGSHHKVRVNQGHIEPVAIGSDTAAPAATTGMDSAMDTPLAPVQISAEKRQSIGVKIGMAQYQQLEEDIRATGTVDIEDGRVSYVQIRFPGYIRRVFANAAYLLVRKGQPLFTVYSPDLVQTQKEYLLAQKNQYTLRGSNIGGVKSGAAALSSAAEDRLRQWAIPESEILKLEQTGQPAADITICSPASGYVIERNALPNMYADSATRLYTIADLSHVWVNAQVFQDDIGRVKPGDIADIVVDAYPNRPFKGRIESILPQIDTATRTVKVRIEVANPGLQLKPGMFVNVRMKTELGRKLVVPASAVYQSGLRQVVFLDRGNGTLEPKEISVGNRVGDLFVVTKGLAAHDRVVTSAEFLIDSESRLEAASGSSAMPMERPAAAAEPHVRIELLTNPTPMHKGPGNQLTIRITNADGTPVTGAEVNVAFCMPAMPEMGMAAINMPAHLSERSAGVYRGTVTLECGGGFQVKIRVQQKGQLLASRQVSVNAEGSM